MARRDRSRCGAGGSEVGDYGEGLGIESLLYLTGIDKDIIFILFFSERLKIRTYNKVVILQSNIYS